ncbi:EcsC family protein [Lachnotalea glycerini]|uniref:EcsC family protein n=1 Tax=Lachnotalea glycerini TaxID=1763509 RepID=A0A318EQG8_9FIRM|nr:EcsC family protein [Lachnotalea glycerini]
MLPWQQAEVDKMEKKQILLKQLSNVDKQERKFLSQKENIYIKNNFKPVMDKFQDKIPEKVKTTLDMAFYKGFQFVFKKGNAYIERTYNKENIKGLPIVCLGKLSILLLLVSWVNMLILNIRKDIFLRK